MARNNTFLYVIVGILALVAIYFIWQHTSKSKSSEKYEHSRTMKDDDIEMVQQADTSELERPDDDYQLLDEPDPAAFTVGFGKGEGIYGSSFRHTSEMIGN